MKLSKVLEMLFEERIPKSFEYKKLCASQSYYFLLASFKVLKLLKKEGLENNRRHWVSDELIGNALNQLVVYYEGTLSPKEIYDCLMLNFDNNYIRLLKDLKQYQKFITKEEVSETKIKELAEYVYSSFSEWIVKNKNSLKNSDSFELRQQFVTEYFIP